MKCNPHTDFALGRCAPCERYQECLNERKRTMAIRLSTHVADPEIRPHRPVDLDGRMRTIVSNGTVLAFAETPAEAEKAERAFELVLAPRFTREEAIAMCEARRGMRFEDGDGMASKDPAHENEAIWAAGYDAGMRAALEALAAAGVFSDDPRGSGDGMASMLDAAGIK